MAGANYYNAKYFDWQQGIGAFGGWANLPMFWDYISPEDKVLDFGGGGGYTISNLKCAQKKIVEINDVARENAISLGVEAHKFTSEVPDEWADVIISNNALEHVDLPLKELQELYRVLRKGGKIVFVVPCESFTYAYKPNDINQHLHSWSPMCIGNLFTRAGFHVIESKPYRHKWPPHYKFISKFGRGIFDLCARIYARIEDTWTQVRVVAEKL
ncbi:MAG: class I SAM-dependent methyltransferase [Synergistaceae bacterium]|nr:class I SAM-dependent methyltransferase [Synergistaceae bacterium]